MRKFPGAGAGLVVALRRGMDKAKANPTQFSAGRIRLIRAGVVTSILTATGAASVGIHNYFGYVNLKRSKELSDAEVQKIQADTTYANLLDLKKAHLRDAVMQRDSYVEQMKAFKWSARFYDTFTPWF